MKNEENNKGRIIFSKNPVFKVDYKVEDPYKGVNGFLALKLNQFGFIDLNKKTKNVLENKKNISLKNLELLTEEKISLSGNRYGNIDFHICKIKEILNSGGNVWIDISMLPHSKNLFKEINDIEIIISDYSFNNLKIDNLGFSYVLGLFGKFYGKKIDRQNAKFLGYVQEKLRSGNDRLSKSELKLILKNIDYIESILERDIPPQNIFNKIRDLVYYY
jgi:hypothetical protein